MQMRGKFDQRESPLSDPGVRLDATPFAG